MVAISGAAMLSGRADHPKISAARILYGPRGVWSVDNVTVVSHNGFSRTEVIRHSIGKFQRDHNHCCGWCGSPARFEYGVKRDDDNRPINGASFGRPFCSIGCWRMYGE